MTIIRRGDTWGFDNRNAFIAHRELTPVDKSTAAGAYMYARFGDEPFWCEDDKGFVYPFRGLTENQEAPSYMRRLARRVAKDLKAEEEQS